MGLISVLGGYNMLILFGLSMPVMPPKAMTAPARIAERKIFFMQKLLQSV